MLPIKGSLKSSINIKNKESIYHSPLEMVRKKSKLFVIAHAAKTRKLKGFYTILFVLCTFN